jgi:lipopolysaccharide export system permease protein
MIFWELCKVFVIALLGITGILLMAGIIAEASQQGLGPAQILAAIPLLIPSTLPYTIPATTLFATCVVYGRLSADNEILAIKASGVNVMQVVKPGLVLGLIMSLATTGLYYRIIPYTHHLLRELAFRDAEELLYSILRRHNMISTPQLPYSMFVNRVQGKKLISPVIKRRNQKGEIDFIAHAREAELRVNMSKKLLFIHMKHVVFITKEERSDGSRGDSVGYDENRTVDIALQDVGVNPNRRARDMTWVELLQRRDELAEQIDQDIEEICAAVARSALSGAPADLPQHIQNLRERLRNHRHQDRLMYVEMLMRPALSFGCLCFILVGCPIGIMFSRGDYLGAFITCFLPIVLVYYPLMLAGTNMAKEGRINEVLLVYAADAIVALGGIVLFRWLLKH